MKYVNLFFEYLKSMHLAEKTINDYHYIFKKIKNYFQGNILDDEKNINENHIIEFIKYLKENNTNDAVYFRTILDLKKYFHFLEKSRIILINPAASIKTPKEITNRTKPISVNEVLKCLNKIKTNSDFGIRSKAIFELFYSTGIRPFELVNLKLNHIDFKNREIFIEKGKMNKDRVIPVGNTALNWIEKYSKEVRPKYLNDKSVNYLFLNITETNFNRSNLTIRNIIYKTFRKYNIKKFKPYSLRVSFATHCLLNGMNIIHIQKILGHNKITTTQRYIHTKNIDLKNVLNKKHPRNKF